MALNKKIQADLINDLGLSSSTISNWCTGLKLPRMDKIQMLADYFNIQLSDLLEDKTSPDLLINSDAGENIIEFKDNQYDKYFDLLRLSSTYDLLKNYKQLNELGKKEALKRVEELTEIKKYIEE